MEGSDGILNVVSDCVLSGVNGGVNSFGCCGSSFLSGGFGVGLDFFNRVLGVGCGVLESSCWVGKHGVDCFFGLGNCISDCVNWIFCCWLGCGFSGGVILLDEGSCGSLSESFSSVLSSSDDLVGGVSDCGGWVGGEFLECSCSFVGVVGGRVLVRVGGVLRGSKWVRSDLFDCVGEIGRAHV